MTRSFSHDVDPKFKGKDKEASAAVPAGAGVHSESNNRSLRGDDDSQSGPSFANRLATSAASLSRAALEGRPNAEAIRNAAAAKAYAQAEASTSSNQGSVNRDQAATYRGGDNYDTGIGSAFSSSRHSTTAGEQQYEGFKGAQPALDISVQLQIPDEAQHGLAGSTNTSHNSHFLRIRSDVNEQEARDGQQVIDLLTAPDELDDLEAIDNLHSFVSLREEESLRKALFSGSGDGPASNWTTLLDFQPNFLQEGNIAELLQHFGVTDPQQAKAMWIDSWADVLATYTDQVWGDLGFLAREAQKEINEAREQGTATTADPGGMQALRRLQQILAHVRGR
ncbi:uncharacterized protein LY79DRAFT_587176 [Colletotrichum navitas]|uniref:Uncharacterized protein n=1 Tax=Colletotrichum navitas TaxID=681940 RepID=A0AAD8V9K5_9PEZI|nr:uncharacterized protein LY79DRAFT_587176 [Colletotrichum navitas]KAK1598084.1 hypothetical protein LY79DRAFT_587176 [Colletotrichum navitas]